MPSKREQTELGVVKNYIKKSWLVTFVPKKKGKVEETFRREESLGVMKTGLPRRERIKGK